MPSKQFLKGKVSWPSLGCLAVPLLCIGFVFVSMFLSYRYNDFRNAKFAEPLFTYPLPENTEVIERLTECFCPINGGTYDIVFRQRMSSTLTREQIHAYYHSISIKTPQEWYIGPEATKRTDQIKTLKLDFDEESIENQIQFSISIGQAFYHPVGFDLRCTNL